MSKGNKAIIIWRGHPMLVPLRHIRPHIGFAWLLQLDTKTSNDSKHLISSLMYQVEDHVLGQSTPTDVRGINRINYTSIFQKILQNDLRR
eukprot:8285314-Pyramimonas_sp.AAC.1